MTHLYRFSEYREIAPGRWLPAKIEASLRKFTDDGHYEYLKTITSIAEGRAGEGIDAVAKDLPGPEKGDNVSDSRFGEPIRYPFDPKQDPAELPKR